MSAIKILHVTYHDGCELDFKFVCNQLKLNLETQRANWNYNIGKNRALEIWKKYKDYYEQFDVIVTSDTAPLSRIFLEGKFNKKLIIWVCNRFDYQDSATNDCGFPDAEYYKLFSEAVGKPNVKIFSYTRFEHEYAKKYRNIDWGNNTIKPCSIVTKDLPKTAFPFAINKRDVFFIPPYHNDNIFMSLKGKCNELQISAYNGRYNGPADLRGLKGIIHIPYAWSNLALFENWSMSNVYFIPTKKFLLKLSKGGGFFWSPPFDIDLLESSEWYSSEHRELFIYFDNWAHLKELVNDNNLITDIKNKILQFSHEHTKKTLNIWQNILCEK